VPPAGAVNPTATPGAVTPGMVTPGMVGAMVGPMIGQMGMTLPNGAVPALPITNPQVAPNLGTVVKRSVTPGAADPIGTTAASPPAVGNQKPMSDAGVVRQASGASATVDGSTANQVIPDTAKGGRQITHNAGAGVNGATSGQVPPSDGIAGMPSTANAAGAGDAVGVAAALASIAKFMPGFSGDGILLVLQAANKMRDIQHQSGKERITADWSARRKANADRAAASKAALDEAKESGGSFWGTLGEVLGAVGAVIVFIYPVGTVLGAICLIISICLLANEVSIKLTGHSLLGNTARIFRFNPDTFDEIDKYISTALQVAVAIMGIVRGDPKSIQWLAKLAAIVSATGTAVSTADKYVAAGHAAEARKARAEASESAATVAQLDENVAQIIKMLKRIMDAGNQVLFEAVELLQARSKVMSQVKFVA
jgi:hypothetical protein